MMGGRLRLCVACDEPSPGPTKRLYYQHRDYGPFFPILEDQRRKSNGYLFSGARVAVCTLCASHLLRQWAYYEKHWTPLEKRTYTLFSEERLARKALKESFISKVSMGTNDDPVELNEQEDHLSKPTKFSSRDKGYETMSDKTLEKSEQWNGEEETDSRKSRSHALWSLPSEDIRSQVREELQENIDVMVRKVAEIQYYENLRRYEKELKDAAERMCQVQDSKGDIDRMCQSLKVQLREELLFRDTLKVLKEEKKENVDEKALLSIEPPPTNLPKSHSRNPSSKPRMTGITHAKKAGKEWQGKTVRKKLKERAASSQLTENSLALVPVPIEEEPEASSRNDGERITSASRKLDVVVRELEKEREWRKRTESIISHQREMIEDLRNGIQGEVQRLIEKQNKRYDEIKANAGKSPRRQQTPGPRAGPNGLSRPSHHKTPYISLDRASSVDHDAAEDDEKRTRLRERRRQRKDRSRDQWEYKRDVPSPARNKKYDGDKKNRSPDDDDDDDDGENDDDDVTADSDDEESPPATPEFYIQ